MIIRFIITQIAALTLSVLLFIGIVIAYAKTMDWIIRKGIWTATKDSVFGSAFILVWFLLTILMVVKAINLAL